ncbi:hypothetical protein Dimus_006354 [Dionaea muscipula]
MATAARALKPLLRFVVACRHCYMTSGKRRGAARCSFLQGGETAQVDVGSRGAAVHIHGDRHAPLLAIRCLSKVTAARWPPPDTAIRRSPSEGVARRHGGPLAEEESLAIRSSHRYQAHGLAPLVAARVPPLVGRHLRSRSLVDEGARRLLLGMLMMRVLATREPRPPSRMSSARCRRATARRLRLPARWCRCSLLAAKSLAEQLHGLQSL